MSFRPLQTNDELEVWKPQPSLGTLAELSFEQGYRDSTLMAGARRKAIADLDARGAKIDPAELNEKYPNLDQPFSRPMSMLAAQHISDETQERRNTNEVLSRASGVFSGYVLPFIAGSAGAMSDPIDFGIGAFLGMASGPMAAAVKGTKSGTLAVRAGITFSENVIANSITELNVKKAADDELMDYTEGQMLTNIIGASLFGTVLSTGAGFIGGKFENLGADKSKVADGVDRMAKLALDEDRSVSEVMFAAKRGIDDDLSIDSDMGLAITDSFESLKADDMIDLKEKLKVGLEDGSIKPDEVEAFKASLNEKGVSPEKQNFLAEEYLPSQKTKSNLTDALKKDSALDENSAVKDIVAKEGVTQDTQLDDLDMRKSELYEAKDLDDFDKADVDNLKQLDTGIRSIDVAQQHIACLLGGLSSGV